MRLIHSIESQKSLSSTPPMSKTSQTSGYQQLGASKEIPDPDRCSSTNDDDGGASASAAAGGSGAPGHQNASTNNNNNNNTSRKDNIRYDDDLLLSYRCPQQSIHYASLPPTGKTSSASSVCGDDDSEEIQDLPSLIEEFKTELQKQKQQDTKTKSKIHEIGGIDPIATVLKWSCLVGYCEAISTNNKNPIQRHQIFPVPLGRIRQLVNTEFDALVKDAVSRSVEDNREMKAAEQQHHRKLVQSIANRVWSKVVPKSNVKDEQHANSLYTCLRGSMIDKKSLDCFGSTLCTVLGVQYYNSHTRCCANDGYYQSYLTLSEDHAYERHIWYHPAAAAEEDVNDQEALPNDESAMNTSSDGDTDPTLGIPTPPVSSSFGTCEVAVPGNTKLAQSKRGRDISETINDKKVKSKRPASPTDTDADSNANAVVTPETSWLYMSKNAVMCDSVGMMLVAVIANINPTIDAPSPSSSASYGSTSLVSGQLYRLKRDLLWVLYDMGYMDKFPFGLLELADCEEHVESHRTASEDNQWVETNLIKRPPKRPGQQKDEDESSSDSPSEPIMVLRIEELYLKAIDINRRLYEESQVYPYLYCAHYHKDAGKHLGSDEEYRFVESMKMYARAAYVASKYPYDAHGSGCLYLNKHMTSVAMLVLYDIMMTTKNATLATGCETLSTSARTTTEKKKSKLPTEPRSWRHHENSVAFGTWLLSFYDSLMVWEESSPDRRQFVEVLSLSHKYSIGKLFSLLPLDVRLNVIEIMFDGRSNEATMNHNEQNENNGNDDESKYACLSNDELVYCKTIRSQRLLSPNSLLLGALKKRTKKISIPEMAMTILMMTPSSSSSSAGGGVSNDGNNLSGGNGGGSNNTRSSLPSSSSSSRRRRATKRPRT